MIDIKIEKGKKHLYLSATGHADYAPYGSDIVCAGVSSIILGLSGALDSRHSEVLMSSGSAVIRTPKCRDNLCFFRVAEKALGMIANEYPSSVKLAVTTVNN